MICIMYGSESGLGMDKKNSLRGGIRIDILHKCRFICFYKARLHEKCCYKSDNQHGSTQCQKMPCN